MLVHQSNGGKTDMFAKARVNPVTKSKLEDSGLDAAAGTKHQLGGKIGGKNGGKKCSGVRKRETHKSNIRQLEPWQERLQFTPR
jgi:hypothetical protein